MGTPGPSSKANPEATRIAEWCEAQYVKEETIAESQLQLVLLTVLAGIFLLLALPRLIYEIDYIWRTDSLPKNIIEKAHDAQKILNNQQEEIKEQVMNAEARLGTMETELEDAKGNLEEQVKQLNVSLAGDLALLQYIPDTTDNELRTNIRKVIKTQDGNFIAVGFTRTIVDVFDYKQDLLLLSSANGHSWTRIPLEKNGVVMTGDLHFLIQANDGTYTATGHESATDKTETVLLLRSSDGETWMPVRPAENGKKLKGRLLSIMQSSDDSFIAAGFEHSEDNTETMLLLRSSDSKTWTPVRPVENGKKLRGHLKFIMQAKDNSFIAVGFERTDDDTETMLLLHSSGGETWTPNRPMEQGKKLTGRLTSIMQAKDKSFFAAGFENYPDHKFERSMVLLRSNDSISWKPIRIEVGGDNILGFVNSVHQLTDGSFIALGHDTMPHSFFSNIDKPLIKPKRNNDKQKSTNNRISDLIRAITMPTVLLLHSSDGNSWTPVPLYKDNKRFNATLVNLFLPDKNSGFSIRVSDSWLKNFNKEDVKSVRSQITNKLIVPPDLVISSNIWPLLDEIRKAQPNVKNLNENFIKQSDYYNKIQLSSDNQQTATDTFAEVTTELDQALHKTELMREGGQIATRIAIVGLLIYLVQILVNRYRYHLRLAKFYKARAQALRLVIGNTEERSAFSSASLSDLAMALSPESIQFDKLSSQSLIYSNQVNDGKVS